MDKFSSGVHVEFEISGCTAEANIILDPYMHCNWSILMHETPWLIVRHSSQPRWDDWECQIMPQDNRCSLNILRWRRGRREILSENFQTSMETLKCGNHSLWGHPGRR